MACGKKPFVIAFFVLGLIALGLHITGFATSNWIVVRLDEEFFVQEQISMEGDVVESMPNMGSEEDIDDADDDDDSDLPEEIDEPEDGQQMIDIGGVMPPSDNDIWNPYGEWNTPTFPPRPTGPGPHPGPGPHSSPGPHPHPGPGPHSSPGPHPRPGPGPHPSPEPGPHPGPGPRPPHHHKHHHRHHHRGEEEENELIGNFMLEAELEFGVETEKEMRIGLWKSKMCVYQPKMVEMDSSESKSSDDDDGHKKRDHKCMKISTKCALHTMGESKRLHFGKGDRLGHATLTEHRVEGCLALGLIVIALVSVLITCRRTSESRIPLFVSAAAMLVAVVMIFVPAARLAHYIHREMKGDIPGLDVKMPHSLLLSALGGVFGVVSLLVVLISLCVPSKTQKGQFHRFHDEDDFCEKKEKSKLAFIAEIVPTIPTLDEPEKKPLE